MKYSCLVFGEGGRDKKFLMVLIDLPKFAYHTHKWIFSYDNASGSSPEVILKQCQRGILDKNYDLVICFIDLDKLKQDYPIKWEEKKKELEKKYSHFKIIWQIDNAEDEYRKTLGDLRCGKYKINRIATKNVKKFINSNYWNRIKKTIKDKEQELEK